MRSDRNLTDTPCIASESLVDWEMRSDRNDQPVLSPGVSSLVDWEMRSDRNTGGYRQITLRSLVDWEMRSDWTWTMSSRLTSGTTMMSGTCCLQGRQQQEE
jgi:hypothetical protein